MRSALDHVLVLALVGLVFAAGLCLLDVDTDGMDLCLVVLAATLGAWTPVAPGRAGGVLLPPTDPIALVPHRSPPTPT